MIVSDDDSYYVCVFGGALLESCTGGLVYRYVKCFVCFANGRP